MDDEPQWWVEDMEHNAWMRTAPTIREAMHEMWREGTYLRRSHTSYREDGGVIAYWFAEYEIVNGNLVNHLSIRPFNDAAVRYVEQIENRGSDAHIHG